MERSEWLRPLGRDVPAALCLFVPVKALLSTALILGMGRPKLPGATRVADGSGTDRCSHEEVGQSMSTYPNDSFVRGLTTGDLASCDNKAVITNPCRLHGAEDLSRGEQSPRDGVGNLRNIRG